MVVDTFVNRTLKTFVNFVNPEHAAACLQDKPSVHLQGQRVELAWGKAKPMSEALQMAVQRGVAFAVRSRMER